MRFTLPRHSCRAGTLDAVGDPANPDSPTVPGVRLLTAESSLIVRATTLDLLFSTRE